ncbi:hypothetical protein C8R42DRAFT_587311 [Lentinula raphanica]|nr:hypothetical protein C8R42DRAFT_587311 [Lentinula raphanica]
MEHDIAGGDHEPFWVGFPLTNIHECIAPDILHQLYQGVLKHLVLWVQLLVGPKELDERIQKLPPTSGVWHFAKGISSLSQVSGTERKHIARILLACLVGKIDSRGITACRAILHFIQLAQYPSHDQDTLQYMEQELDAWHKNRDYFIDKEAREHINIPKFHSLLHYIDSIQWIGTTDNSNTEAFERLHIDFAKEGWRASNKRDHFPQMIAFVSRQEKISSFDFYHSSGRTKEESQVLDDSSPVILFLSKTPSEPRKTLSSIAILHEAPGFLTSLKLFLNNFVPKKSPPSTRNEIINGLIPFNTLEVWHSFGLTPLKVLDKPEKLLPLSSSSSTPRYDTVIILENDKAESTAVQGSIGLSSCLWSLD